ncbi:hypothetical protein [Zafaria sp. J156]|uniref:hypothetical protein n=1 Tax=Zafaria sp. J156 TaxID=3116490 RepID=UPI002E7A67B4|nr:hypothetical protein [Zafaria sp. J156]MEE1622290.1 hypothetical protein [Zafaria sp. J156]
MGLHLLSFLDFHCRDQALTRLRADHPDAVVVVHDPLEGVRVLCRTDIPGRSPWPWTPHPSKTSSGTATRSGNPGSAARPPTTARPASS